MPLPTAHPDAITAIVAAYHGAPFDVLGPHQLESAVVVRAFLPQAASVELVETGGQKRALPMTRVHSDGFFEGVVEGVDPAFAYLLGVMDRGGSQSLHEDPYRFPPTLGDYDSHLLAEGTHLHIYQRLGAHLIELNGVKGVRFAVWAPNARRVSVIGDFNNWDGRRHPMRFHSGSGIWELFMPGLGEGTQYKYEVHTQYRHHTVAKADPVGFRHQLRPNTASIVADLNGYQWRDETWLAERGRRNSHDAPMCIYELHLGSWRRKQDNQWLTYRELAETLIPYIQEMGYTHIELLPVAEHPYDGSWGYQVTGFFAPTSRFGPPKEFMAFVDACHQAGIGVILDWVPAHFPRDQHGLSYFDGTHLYEHSDPRQGAHPDWGTLIFNYGRLEVRQFLISNALFWLEKYHIDGLRVDAVASMLYLDFSRQPGEWLPNVYGGRENLEAIAFIRLFNDRLHSQFPDVITIAEESTSWPGVTRPTAEGGLGFDYKWNMGWMHDTLQYIRNDPIYRAFHHGTITFSLHYAFSEKFLLPFSHDEVVHLKRSMLDKMPGDEWQRFANLRVLYAYHYAHPGKKLLFMGGEFGQWHEWTEAQSLDWHLLESGDEKHQGLQRFVKALNHLYTSNPALAEEDYAWDGFKWLDLHDFRRSILAFARIAPKSQESLLILFNFTPIVRYNYRLGVPRPGLYHEILNSDDPLYGGSGVLNAGPLASSPTPWHESNDSLELTLPPLAAVFLKWTGPPPMNHETLTNDQ